MKKMPDHLPIHMVLQMANAACEKYGFKKLIGAELNTMYTTRRIVPAVIRTNNIGMLWVDKWYIAVQLGAGEVRYLYLTRRHISEEVGSYRCLRKLRENAPTLPVEIVEQFRTAHKWMALTEQELYLSEAAEPLNLNWVSGWRDATRKELQKLLPTKKKRSA